MGNRTVGMNIAGKLKTKRTARDRLRSQIRPQATGCGPSLYDPLSADKTGGAVRGAWIPLIVPCVHRSMGGVSPCAAARRRSRFVPAHGSRQTGANPLPLASVTRECLNWPLRPGTALHCTLS